MSELTDNRARRLRILRGLIQGLRQGVAFERAKGQLVGAVRDAKGDDFGTLEVTPDLTPLRAPGGARPLLQHSR